MIFVRGIMGNIKLNPAIKIWGTISLIVAAGMWGLYDRFTSFRETVAECQTEGGVWVGGIMTGAHCAIENEGDDW